MQGNGFKVFLTVAFLLLSGYYLYPTIQGFFLNHRIESMDDEARAQYEQENFQKIQSVQEKQLKLGLDLLGGMHVTLEVRVEALLRELATDTDATFESVLDAAYEQARTGDISVIDAFVSEFERRDPQARLSRYFRNSARGITRSSSNGDVAEYLSLEAQEAVERAIEIIRQRIDRYGVTEPSIQRQGTRRIAVELPGIDDPDRVRRLLRGTARLEFRLMAEPENLRRSLQDIIEFYEQTPADTSGLSEAEDTLGTGNQLAEAEADTLDAAGETSDTPDTTLDIESLLADETDAELNPLLSVMQPLGQGVRFGLVAVTDTAAANRLLQQGEVQALLPSGVKLMYSSSPIGLSEDGRELFELLGVRDQIELTGEVVTDARVEFSQTNQPEVTMTMNSEGARVWSRITGANINKPVAIVLDDVVYNYPTVINRITRGNSSITGLGSREEAQDIVTVLKSGALPAPVEIIEERMVGPSLGAASIRAGLNSVLIGLSLVALFMIFYYRTAGIAADLALIINIVFILGILAGFNATLTLPGIAGIVLTIGMAVDANVLIFERIREEQTTGKTLKASVEGGYAKALSAIFDANITTFFVGAILYSFGVGPIQGFAVTLMAGILASLFSAIVFTRILFDYAVAERRMSVSFG